MGSARPALMSPRSTSIHTYVAIYGRSRHSLISHVQLCWFMAGRVLVRFMKAAQDAQAQDQVVPLNAEITFLR